MAEQGTNRDRDMKWNGWGFKDSYFYLDKDSHFHFSGKDRYEISGHVLPRMRKFMEDLRIEKKFASPAQTLEQMIAKVPTPIRNEEFIKLLTAHNILHSFDKKLRLHRAHGHSLADVFTLRHGTFARIPDVVVWPRNHDEVVHVVSIADANNVAIIPVGGGTSACLGLMCPENETRMIVSMDMGKMTRLLGVNRENLTARAEAGCVGIDLELELNKLGYTMGHEPDSKEFSTLGGWVATRASGMKRGKYGNIEDMLVHVTFVTPKGVIQKSCQAPRMSSGPDADHFILGSEGTLGVVTEVTFKVWPKPECTRYGSIVFPTFENGINCKREIAQKRCCAASMRLVDNYQFRTSRGFKPGELTLWRRLKEQIQDLYITRWKGFHPDEVCAMAIVFEGTEEEVKAQEKTIYRIAASYGGFSGGATNGRHGYMLIFSVAYLRDVGMDYSSMGESVEPSAPWDKVLAVCNNVKEVYKRESEKIGITNYIVSSRIAQAYEAGACIYIYYVFNYHGIENPLETYEAIEDKVRDAILAAGGSISHHHGVGKRRGKWLPLYVGHTGMSAVKAVKQALDPNNIFANGNLFVSHAKL